VSLYGLVDRVLGVGELGRGVDERTSAEPLPAHGFGDRDHEGVHQADGVWHPGGGSGELGAILSVSGLDVGDDEVLLAGKVPIEGGPCHRRLRQQAVHADRVDAFGVEQPRRGLQQPVARC
jgi:hypothetical protein